MSNEGSWIDQAEHDAQKASGGGGIVAQCEINRGYKVYVSGLSNKDSFFPFNPSDESSKKAALGKAQSAGGRPQDSVELIIYQASVKNKNGDGTSVGASWKGDRYFNYDLWTVEFKEIFMPAIKESKPPLGQKFWGKVVFLPNTNPKAKQEEYQGVMRAKPVATVAQVYKSEADAAVDVPSAGSNGSEPETSDPMVPADYSKADWLSMKQDVADAVNAAIREAEAKTKGKPKPVIAKAVEAARSEAIATKATELAASVEQVNALLTA